MGGTPRHSVSVAAAIVDRDSRLLAIQRRDNGAWELPGGILELGESIPQGLRREVREETGLDVEPGRLTGVYKNMTRGIVALVFRCDIVGGELTPNEEARAFRWFTPAEIQQEMTPAFGIRLLDALDSQAHIRAHDGVSLIEA